MKYEEGGDEADEEEEESDDEMFDDDEEVEKVDVQQLENDQRLKDIVEEITANEDQ